MQYLRNLSSSILWNIDSEGPASTSSEVETTADTTADATAETTADITTVTATTTENNHHDGIRLSSFLGELDRMLSHKNIFTDLLRKVEHTSTIKCRTQVIIVAIFVLLYLAEGYAAALLCNILTLLLPLLASIAAIENPAFESDTKWLMYWVIYASVNFLEAFLSWLPSYNLLKFLVLAWCMAPGRLSGSGCIYFKFVRPLFLKHRRCVNGVISDAARRVSEVTDSTVDEFLAARTSKLLQETGSLHRLQEGEKKED